ncbi:MAG: ATPase P [Negativicutes bacterium]|uniref:ATPase P n=1 Tax=Pseudomonas gingeri TaxID=117681 RepID=A0A7Y7WJB3_9PSED|nr:ATPase P [Pseudomonas gingeri]MDR3561464.1 ATPase P [Negativicutes bacterium]NWB49838.1 ATPase P [Pseudomonas gingeri]
MLSIDIPGRGKLELKHLVCDYNGTLAFDGTLLEGVQEKLQALSSKVSIHVLTGDTFGTAQEQLSPLDINLMILPVKDQGIAKEDYLRTLGAAGVVAIGNGSNDRHMLNSAALGIAVMGGEGVAMNTLTRADLVVQSVQLALDLLLEPRRLIASLRT